MHDVQRNIDELRALRRNCAGWQWLVVCGCDLVVASFAAQLSAELRVIGLAIPITLTAAVDGSSLATAMIVIALGVAHRVPSALTTGTRSIPALLKPRADDGSPSTCGQGRKLLRGLPISIGERPASTRDRWLTTG